MDKDGDLPENEGEKFTEEAKRLKRVEDERNQQSETELVPEAKNLRLTRHSLLQQTTVGCGKVQLKIDKSGWMR